MLMRRSGGWFGTAVGVAGVDEMVAPEAASGRELGPWDVVVPMLELTVTEPLLGAVYEKPMVSAAPLARFVAMPVNVTVPVPLSYAAVTPGGSDGKETPLNPGVRWSAYVAPAAVDGPALA